jgi:hypothetical protein
MNTFAPWQDMRPAQQAERPNGRHGECRAAKPHGCAAPAPEGEVRMHFAHPK